ncbi:Uncharacterised protein [Mycobacterium tuberculosis]|nr:Uncharacterised protein [Mycobacterium tuberculosis]
MHCNICETVIPDHSVATRWRCSTTRDVSRIPTAPPTASASADKTPASNSAENTVTRKILQIR